MEMEMEVPSAQVHAQAEDATTQMGILGILMERLSAAADAVTQAAGTREAALEARLREAEAIIATLRSPSTGRKTRPAGVLTLAAKGLTGERDGGDTLKSIDAALVGLSLEQRIAVKARMLRDGLIG